LKNINQIISNASSVIAKYLNIWLYYAMYNRMNRPCNLAFYKLHFLSSALPCLQFSGWSIQ
jgi:hypothetical protein